MIEVIREAWGWSGLRPVEEIRSNAFGNVLVRDEAGRFWRICPEELSCKIVAKDPVEFEHLVHDFEFLRDWSMTSLVAVAAESLGPLADGCCYCLKIPAVLGGKYGAENIGTISIEELISASGDMAAQIKDLPDGAQIRLRVEP